MKILAVSDVEEPLLDAESKRVTGIDVIISCGDLNESYLSYLSTVFGAPLFYVRGNHDQAITPSMSLGENLHDRLVKYRNLKMLGFEGVLDYTSQSVVQYSEFELNWMVRMFYIKAFFRGKPNIIVTHAPPQGLHEGSDYAHRGPKAFRKLIDHFQPEYFLHGHTHLNYQRNLPRITQVGVTKVVNVYGYYVFEI